MMLTSRPSCFSDAMLRLQFFFLLSISTYIGYCRYCIPTASWYGFFYSLINTHTHTHTHTFISYIISRVVMTVVHQRRRANHLQGTENRQCYYWFHLWQDDAVHLMCWWALDFILPWPGSPPYRLRGESVWGKPGARLDIIVTIYKKQACGIF